MPFGLTKAPQLLRSLDEPKVLNEYLDQFVVVYLDDIVVFSPSLEEDQVHLRSILFVIPILTSLAAEHRYVGLPSSSSWRRMSYFLSQHRRRENYLASENRRRFELSLLHTSERASASFKRLSLPNLGLTLPIRDWWSTLLPIELTQSRQIPISVYPSAYRLRAKKANKRKLREGKPSYVGNLGQPHDPRLSRGKDGLEAFPGGKAFFVIGTSKSSPTALWSFGLGSECQGIRRRISERTELEDQSE
ncbi:RNA-directed DNA polymerase-like protein [Cucumis melo var. makuwa]|uniref:RNA-directed DNA polymerase-like protein n=1 Tax=Cucumis melo var. makuwa TaxID=1194695 RepID=A0A5A7V665_CUCMM|nr:RNA-directed DNA polymerase-like protein [Cucumis melo var. makuwa]